MKTAPTPPRAEVVDSQALNRSGPRLGRRLLMASLVLALTGPAVLLMADLHWRTGFNLWKGLHLALFAGLFALVAFGTVHAAIGFFLRLGGGDRRRLIRTLAPDEAASAPLGPTAVVMPIFNEDPAQVFARLRAIYRSLVETDRLDFFHFYVLSDSNDPNRWIEEQTAWVSLVQELGAQGRLFYRRRRVNTNKKAGNLADFCRRWGRRHRYMIVLDADSTMTGEALVRLVQLMERNPRAGIVQTVPRLVRGTTPFARLQQFASRLYGPVFQAGLNYWQLGEANYWGHNAIVRIAPFIAHCSLPELPGREPFGGRILSHDYVEAALMCRAGWQVWLAVDLDGSFEECPANLIDFAKRDRRWLQGNLQHSWLLTARGLRPAHRLHLLMGILAYLASPLWLAFLLVSTLLVWRHTVTGLTLVPRDSLADLWNLSFQGQALLLFGGTLGLLFLPKLLALIDLMRRPGAAASFGGWPRLAASVALETLASALVAPVLMLFHSKFILWTLLGRGVAWVTQRRGGDGDPDWREAILTHSGQSVFAAAWGAFALTIDRTFAAWLAPVLAGPLLAVPLTLITGDTQHGRRLRRAGLLLTPEETNPPAALRELERHLAALPPPLPPRPEFAAHHGLLRAALDPYVNAVHLSLLREKFGRDDPTTNPARDRFARLREKLIAEGPAALAPAECKALLLDAASMLRVHRELWSRPAERLAPWWREAMSNYHLLAPARPAV
jgi:membrane glycosyltransferase